MQHRRNHYIKLGPLAMLLLSISHPVLAQPPFIECSASASPVVFGVYDRLLGTPTQSTGTVTITCLRPFGIGRRRVSYEIHLSTGGSGSYTPRTMFSANNTLNYNLYTDSTYSVIFGDGTAGTETVRDEIRFPLFGGG